MRAEGLDEALIPCDGEPWLWPDRRRKAGKGMEKVLFAVDELTGLIGAAALMRPSRSVQDLELKSVKKKFKTKALLRAAPGK